LRSALFVDQSVSSKAVRAAPIAARMSSADASATGPSTSSVAGLMLSNVFPEAASTRSPPMSMRTSPVPDMCHPLVIDGSRNGEYERALRAVKAEGPAAG